MANKKINQLVSKTAILSTDLFGIGDATTGQLFKKTIAELQAAIGGAVISVNGLVGTVVLDTDDIQELATPTNKYFTDARARGAISLTVTGNSGASTYSSGTGVLNVPTYTLAGLGGITASFLSGTSGISYNSTTGVISYSGTVYTDSSIRALLSGGTGITYNSSTGAISYSGTVYTDSSVRALISITTTGTSGASTYNNTTGVINVPEYTLAGLGGISLTSLSGGTGITYNNTTGAISYSGTVYTDASVRALISASTGLSYNNTTGVFTSTITQYTDALARASISLTTTGTSGASTYNSTTGVFNIPQYQGAITLTTTGTSGAATFSSGTLNIPQYQAVLTNPVTGTGTSGHVAYWNGSGSIAGSANHFWDNTNGRLGIGTTSPSQSLHVVNSASPTVAIFAGSSNSFIQLGTSTQNYIGNNGGNLVFQAGASENMRITSAGNVGIGTASPQSALSFSTTSHIGVATVDGSDNGYMSIGGGGEGGDARGAGMYFSGNERTTFGGQLAIFAGNVGTSGFINFNTGGSERMRITSGGAVLIGTDSTAASYQLHVVKSGASTFIGVSNQGAASGDRQIRIGFGGTQSYAEIQGTRNGVADDVNIAINPGGSANLLVGTSTNNGEKLYVSGSIRATGSITANSDITLKKNLLKIENALEKVEQINGYTYEFKEDDSKRHAGVIAQEIQTVLPEIVNKGNDGILGVEYGNISALLIEAIKEQNTKIKNLETLLASK